MMESRADQEEQARDCLAMVMVDYLEIVQLYQYVYELVWRNSMKFLMLEGQYSPRLL